VQFYGKLYPQVIYAKSSSPTQPGSRSPRSATSGVLGGTPPILTAGSRIAVDSQNSYLGFRGERSSAIRVKGIWQIEQSIELDGAIAGVFSNRNTFLGSPAASAR